MSQQELSFRILDDFIPTDNKTPLAVALSGGPDSMALCRLLSQWAAEHGGVEIHALTVDHSLREEAAAEAAQVGAWVKDWPHVTHAVLKRNLSGLGKTRILEEARKDRYKLLSAYCGEKEISKLFVAHHCDDQAETFLFRLAKGSGLDGLSCMHAARPFDEQITLLRPLLPVGKPTLITFCKENNIPYVNDPSNDDSQFSRARLRRSAHILEQEGLSSERLFTTARRFSRAREALDLYAARTLQKASIEIETDRLVLNFDIWFQSPEETRLRMLQKIMDDLHEATGTDKGYGPRMARLENLATRLYGEESFKSATLGGFLFAVDRKQGYLTVEREKTL